LGRNVSVKMAIFITALSFGEVWRAQPSAKKPTGGTVGAAEVGGVEGAALHKKT
jgi:hypothetical protein